MRSAFIGVPQGEQLLSEGSVLGKEILRLNTAALRNRFHCADRCCDAAKPRLCGICPQKFVANLRAPAPCRRIHYWRLRERVYSPAQIGGYQI
jgi:hypothetical protein